MKRPSLRQEASVIHVQTWRKASMALVNLNKLTVAYSGVVALKNVSFQIDAGEIVTIVGPNGSGKTSLLKAIIGAIVPQEGNVDVKSGLKIGYVPQRLNLDPTLPISVGRFMKLSENVSKKECQRALEQAGVAAIMAKQMSELSGGQLQRVLLAKALLGSPEMLLLDEATQGLDQPGAAEFYKQIESYEKKLVVLY